MFIEVAIQGILSSYTYTYVCCIYSFYLYKDANCRFIDGEDRTSFAGRNDDRSCY